jgi:hypothetical protein
VGEDNDVSMDVAVTPVARSPAVTLEGNEVTAGDFGLDHHDVLEVDEAHRLPGDHRFPSLVLEAPETMPTLGDDGDEAARTQRRHGQLKAVRQPAPFMGAVTRGRGGVG